MDYNSSWKIHSWTLKTLCYSTRHSSSQETVQLLSSSSVSVGASPCRTSGTESAHQCSRHRSLIPGLGRSPGGGHGNLPQYSHLENPHGQRRLVGHSPEGDEVLDTTEATYVHEGWDFVSIMSASSEAGMVPGPWLIVTSIFWTREFCCSCYFLESLEPCFLIPEILLMW